MPAIGTVLPRVSVGSWCESAACEEAPVSARWAPSSIFFADLGRDPVSRLEQAEAKGICLTCPVQVECLDYALEARIEDGIWGGTTGRERERIRRRRAAVAS